MWHIEVKGHDMTCTYADKLLYSSIYSHISFYIHCTSSMSKQPPKKKKTLKFRVTLVSLLDRAT